MVVKIPGAALKLLKPLTAHAARIGLRAYLVGGGVRDWILGFKTSDFDLVTEGDPAPLARFCARKLKVQAQAFGQFGTLRVIGAGLRFDFAMTRREFYASPAALPQVSPAGLKEDLFRRDFTINAMAIPLPSGPEARIIDPYGGEGDSRAGILRVLHPASFRDDPTRVFRAARFSCRFGFNLEAGLMRAAQETLEKGYAASLSRHRLMQELLCVLDEKDPACAIGRLRKWGYLQLIYPQLTWPKRCLLKHADERLGLMALSLGAKGEEFIRSLPLDHQLSLEFLETLKTARGRASPRGAFPPLAARILSHEFPRLAKSALKPLMLGGEDLKRLGLAPGKDYRRILDAAAKAQWAGKISTRARALSWLRRHSFRA